MYTAKLMKTTLICSAILVFTSGAIAFIYCHKGFVPVKRQTNLDIFELDCSSNSSSTSLSTHTSLSLTPSTTSSTPRSTTPFNETEEIVDPTNDSTENTLPNDSADPSCSPIAPVSDAILTQHSSEPAPPSPAPILTRIANRFASVYNLVFGSQQSPSSRQHTNMYTNYLKTASKSHEEACRLFLEIHRDLFYNPNANSNTNPNPNPNPNPIPNPDTNSNTNPNPNSDTNSNTNPTPNPIYFLVKTLLKALKPQCLLGPGQTTHKPILTPEAWKTIEGLLHNANYNPASTPAIALLKNIISGWQLVDAYGQHVQEELAFLDQLVRELFIFTAKYDIQDFQNNQLTPATFAVLKTQIHRIVKGSPLFTSKPFQRYQQALLNISSTNPLIFSCVIGPYDNTIKYSKENLDWASIERSLATKPNQAIISVLKQIEAQTPAAVNSNPDSQTAHPQDNTGNLLSMASATTLAITTLLSLSTTIPSSQSQSQTQASDFFAVVPNQNATNNLFLPNIESILTILASHAISIQRDIAKLSPKEAQVAEAIQHLLSNTIAPAIYNSILLKHVRNSAFLKCLYCLVLDPCKGRVDYPPDYKCALSQRELCLLLKAIQTQRDVLTDILNSKPSTSPSYLTQLVLLEKHDFSDDPSLSLTTCMFPYAHDITEKPLEFTFNPPLLLALRYSWELILSESSINLVGLFNLYPFKRFHEFQN
ncbi:hypothetical protein NEHOM01_1701 [Nematocida homosporus]|uniref:uncharacterized protein n=1 Tax=Nematocida homosporus TaxID=1912981 RepID=UPI0022202413|nr:uncharacterized protein NEHOM01_1701 [Nematocida homosporus]KAI5186781.1 hypothetical protein NEHOM01_1701 [Nematocida homosporus]